MKQLFLFLLLVLLYLQAEYCLAQDVVAVKTAEQQLTPAEMDFAEQLSNAQLVGRYTTWDDPDTPKKDTYTLDRVTKLQDDYWTSSYYW